MPIVIGRLLWAAFVSSGAAYSMYLMFAGIFGAQPTPSVVVHDAVQAGRHLLSGTAMVPTACDELTVKVIPLTLTTYILNLHTWTDPSVDCPKNETPRSFNTVAFAPAFGVQFIVYLDGQTVPFDLTTVFPHKTP